MKTNKFTFIISVMVAYFLSLGGVLSANAQEAGEEEIEFNIQGGDDTPIDPGQPKTPILVPTAWLNGHVVDFHSRRFCGDSEKRIRR